MASKTKPSRKAFLALNLIAIGGIIFLRSGAYTDAVEAKARTISFSLDSTLDPGVAANLTGEDYRQINCLARNAYFEAGNQGADGMRAVDDVVLNRADHRDRYPGSACQVVAEGVRDFFGKLVLYRCQFTWRCDGQTHDVLPESDRWREAFRTAFNDYAYRKERPDVTGGALRYHADYVNPVWRGWHPVKKIGAHIFYVPGAK